MLKIKFILLLSIVIFTTQHVQDCRNYDQEDCERSVNCRWTYETNPGCSEALYYKLGPVRVIEQEVVFSNSTNHCSSKLNEKDFLARQTFNHRHFQSFCNMINIHQIQVNNVFYKNGDKLRPGPVHSAIIYPVAPKGCAYLFSRKYFRGDSWLVCRPTKLNGQIIRSLMIGGQTRISLYDREGHETEYSGLLIENITINVDHIIGLENIRGAKKVEYVLVEGLFDAKP